MDKVKIRISSYVTLIIDNDAQRFGFVKRNNSPNRNMLINKLVPNLLFMRQYRREKIRELLSNMGKERVEEIYEAVNQVIDEVYFKNAELEIFDSEIWVLPTQNAEKTFDEIENSELAITSLTITEYLRGLLNEYSLLPQYKREEMVFYDELREIYRACDRDNILRFEFENEKFKFYPYQHMYGFLYEQTNYLIGYDITAKSIRSFPLSGLRNLYALKSVFRPSEDLIGKLQTFLNEYNYSPDNIVYLGDDYENR